MAFEEKIAGPELLKPFMDEASSCGLAAHVAAFIHQQRCTWTELHDACENLKKSYIKEMHLSQLDVVLQHNPNRIKSSTSPVDKISIAQRPCFLCPGNLYPLQKGLLYQDAWFILNNPFPIFFDHLVVSRIRHTPQQIEAALPVMIRFVRDLGFTFCAFYNGPACGASAPDHLHFQACPEGTIPITQQIARLHQQKELGAVFDCIEKRKGVSSFAGTADNRTFFISVADDGEMLHMRLRRVLEALKQRIPGDDEPMVNLIISGVDEQYVGIIIPRKAHRPSCYYSDGTDRMLVSPGAVDVGGLLIVPRRQDYTRLTAPRVLAIFSEVCHTKDVFDNITITPEG